MPDQEKSQLALNGTGQVTVRIARPAEKSENIAPEPETVPEAVQMPDPEPEMITEAVSEPVPAEQETPEQKQGTPSPPVPEPAVAEKSVRHEVIEEAAPAAATSSAASVPEVKPTISAGDAFGSGATAQPQVQAIRQAEPLTSVNQPPVYPVLARRRGWEGTVMLEVDVKSDGTVLGVRVQSGSSYGLLDQAALEAVRRWRFTPGSRDRIPVATKVIVPVHFMLQDD